jgi:integrase
MDRVVRRNAAGQHVIVDEGKGQASIRRVRVDPDAARMFRRRMIGKAPGDLVFTTPVSAQNGLGGSQWHESNYLTRYWNPAVKAANLSRRPTPHWLRHTHVVWMALSGASLPELQSRIGHASITTTINVYGRMLSDVQPAALTAFAAMRGGQAHSGELEG